MESLIVEKIPIPIPKAKQVSLKSYWLTIGEMRFDASFYAKEAVVADRVLKETGYKLLDLAELTKNVFYPPRVKRYYTNKASEGTPYLTSSETQWFIRKPEYILSKKLRNLAEWYVKDGWILLTRSGTVGLLILATRDLEKYILSEHMIRIVPKEDTLTGYLYAYLSSWFGQTYISKEIFGGVVEEVEPHHIQTIPVPKLPDEIQKIIHSNIIRVSDIREKARSMLLNAEELVYEKLGIPKLSLDVSRQSFTVNSIDLDMRFDASFHDPILKTVKDKLKASQLPLRRLDDKEVSTSIFIPNRFKRTYVDKDFGVPFLSGTNIIQTKPHNLKYLSRRTRHLENYLLGEGTILVAARGTIGRIMPVTKSTSGWAASDNIARIIPNKDKVNYGFLTCFLNTAYGQTQLVGQTAGSMVNLIQPSHIGEVQVPIPSEDIQKMIGNLVVDAYELKEKANIIETLTLNVLEELLREGKNADLRSYWSTFEIISDEKLDLAQALIEEKQDQLGSWEELKKETGLDEI
jgi:type I restriction enzyme S subunit